MEKIISRRNPLCLHIKKLGASRIYRESCGQYLCDGVKLLEEAINCNAKIETVLTSSDITFQLPANTKVYYTDRDMIDSISPLKNAQDTLFTCIISKPCDYEIEHGIHVFLDGVQDPGNVGSIIRTANAFGVGAVLLSENCADMYNPKTIRSSMGAIFRQDVRYSSISGLSDLRKKGFRIIGATACKDSLKIYDVDYKDTIIIIGSEGSGISGDVLQLCDEKVFIPIAPECESLNASVAAAIIIWEAGKSKNSKDD